MNEATWSLGVKLGLPIAGLIVIACATLIIIALEMEDDSYGMNDRWFYAVPAIVVFSVTLVATAVAMWPYSAEYHQHRPVTGTVDSVSSRLVGTDGGATQKFVVSFGDGEQYGCEDTRCSLIERGDTVTLSCKRAWQYVGRDGWDCAYVDHKEEAK